MCAALVAGGRERERERERERVSLDSDIHWHTQTHTHNNKLLSSRANGYIVRLKDKKCLIEYIATALYILHLFLRGAALYFLHCLFFCLYSSGNIILLGVSVCLVCVCVLCASSNVYSHCVIVSMLPFKLVPTLIATISHTLTLFCPFTFFSVICLGVCLCL